MPSEIRHIIFSPEEVVRAVVDYHRRSGKALPTGSVIRTTYEREPTVRCALHMGLDADSSRHVVWIEEPILAASLIFFCIQNGIPLPTKAAKNLQMLNEQVALRVTRTPADSRRGAATVRGDRS